jgi:AcrR family transcriptional regulator
VPKGMFRNVQIWLTCSESENYLMPKEKDRRIQRTKQLLREALFSLIKEKGFETLSVQDIIDRANVGRATFYAHFDNKEDLLLSGFDGLRASLRARQRDAHSGSLAVDQRAFAFIHELLAHIEEHRQLFRVMAGKRSGAVVQNIVRKLVVDLVRDDLKTVIAPGDARSNTTNAGGEFIAAGLFGMLVWWLDTKPQLSIEELNALFRQFAIPAAKAALQPQPAP